MYARTRLGQRTLRQGVCPDSGFVLRAMDENTGPRPGLRLPSGCCQLPKSRLHVRMKILSWRVSHGRRRSFLNFIKETVTALDWTVAMPETEQRTKSRLRGRLQAKATDKVRAVPVD